MKTAVILTAVLFFAVDGFSQGDASMKITSSVFEHNQGIPEKYTCQGQDINPPLKIEGIPDGTKSLTLIVDDPDAPFKTWVHWVVFDIPAAPVVEIPEDSIAGKQGSNDFGRNDYGGPCPPSGTHRYFHKAYALDKILNVPEGISKKDLEKAIQTHILAKAELIGLYKKR